MLRFIFMFTMFGDIVFDSNAIKPSLCIEKNEGNSLCKTHKFLKDAARDGWKNSVLLPKNDQELVYVYDDFLKNKRSSYFMFMGIEVALELESRFEDQNTEYIDNYINILRSTLNIVSKHDDREFSELFISEIERSLYDFVFDTDKKVKKHPEYNKACLINITKTISDILEEVRCDTRRNKSLFEFYRDLCLTGEYWQSEEGQNMINAVTGALSEGFSLK